MHDDTFLFNQEYCHSGLNEMCSKQQEVTGPALHAGLQESVTRNYAVKAGLPNSEPEVTESQPDAKSHENGPYSGSKVRFSVPDAACAPLQALDAITAALETITLVAPPVAVNLSISGVEALLQVRSLLYH